MDRGSAELQDSLTFPTCAACKKKVLQRSDAASAASEYEESVKKFSVDVLPRIVGSFIFLSVLADCFKTAAAAPLPPKIHGPPIAETRDNCAAGAARDDAGAAPTHDSYSAARTGSPASAER